MAEFAFGTRKGGIAHKAKLNLISDFLQSIVADRAFSAALISAAARERRLKSLAAAPRSDLARWAPAFRWLDPPLLDG